MEKGKWNCIPFFSISVNLVKVLNVPIDVPKPNSIYGAM